MNAAAVLGFALLPLAAGCIPRGLEGGRCRAAGDACSPGLLCLSSLCVGPLPPVLSPDAPGEAVVSSGPDGTYEAESTVVAAPDGRVAAAWISSGPVARIGYAFSRDRGATWEAPKRLPAPSEDPGRAADPVLAVDHRGTIHLAWLWAHWGKGTWTREIFVSSAPAGSVALGPPVRVSDPEHPQFDKPTIAVTPRGTILVAMDRRDGDGTAEVARSEDGVRWTRTLVVADRVRNRWIFQICAPRSGDRVWLASIDVSHVALQWSDDDGRTWTTGETIVSRPEERFRAGGLQATYCAGEGDDLWVLYGLHEEGRAGGGEAVTPAAGELRLAVSRDGGKTFPTHLDVDDERAGTRFLLPQLARSPDGGLHLVYYASTPGAPFGSLVWAESHDGGRTFSAPRPLHESIHFTGGTGSRWLGHYLGVDTGLGNLHVAYADNSGDTSRVAYHRRPIGR